MHLFENIEFLINKVPTAVQLKNIMIYFKNKATEIKQITNGLIGVQQ